MRSQSAASLVDARGCSYYYIKTKTKYGVIQIKASLNCGSSVQCTQQESLDAECLIPNFYIWSQQYSPQFVVSSSLPASRVASRREALGKGNRTEIVSSLISTIKSLPACKTSHRLFGKPILDSWKACLANLSKGILTFEIKFGFSWSVRFR